MEDSECQVEDLANFSARNIQFLNSVQKSAHWLLVFSFVLI